MVVKIKRNKMPPIKSISRHANIEKAKRFMLDSLEVCAHEHKLSKELLRRFPDLDGEFNVCIFDWYNLDEIPDYSICKSESLDYQNLRIEHPKRALENEVERFLSKGDSPIVVSENFGWDRSTPMISPWCPSKVAFFQNEVLHILQRETVFQCKSEDERKDIIERSINPRHHWQTTIFSHYAPEVKDELTETFFSDLVSQTVKVVVPAFDGDGFLTWSPAR